MRSSVSKGYTTVYLTALCLLGVLADKTVNVCCVSSVCLVGTCQWRTQKFCSGGGRFQQIQLRAEDRENGDLGAAAP